MLSNRFYRPRLIFILIICIPIVILLIFYAQKLNVCKKLGCLSMQGLNDFKTQEVYQEDDNIYRALLSKDSDLLRVDIRSDISEPEGKSHIQAQITRMKALFENAPSPYPGEISDEIACGEKYKPAFFDEEINGIQVSYSTGYLNNRLVFGSCTEDQAVYHGILALFYCPNLKQLYQIEIIAPADKFTSSPQSYQQMLKSISCKK